MIDDSAMPSEWHHTTLGTVAQWGSGGTPSRKQPEYYGGVIPWVKTGDLGPKVLSAASEYITELGLKKSSAKYFPKGSVAIAMYGATIGKTSILGFDATTNQACGVGQPINGVTDTRFLYYLLRNEKDAFIAKGKGGAQPNISQALIRDHEIALPPLAEQKVIADKLETLLAQVENTKTRLERIPQIVKRFRQTVLSKAVSGRLTEEWRLEKDVTLMQSAGDSYSLAKQMHKSHFGRKYKSPIEPDLRMLDDIPASWTYGIASHLVEPNAEIVYGIVQPGPKLADGVPYVRGTDIQNGQILVGQLLKTSESIARKYSRASLRSNDVLLGIIRATKVAVVPAELRGANITQGTARFRPISSVLNYRYLAYYLNSPKVQAWFHSNYRGIDMPGLNLKDVRRLPIALPGLAEQTETVRRVDQLFAYADRIEHKVNKALARVNNLTQSILAKAFRGELTEQWRKDNPELIRGENSAEALLARINADRVAKKPAAKVRVRSKF